MPPQQQTQHNDTKNAGTTVIALKTAFLRTQTRILSQPLRLPDTGPLSTNNNTDTGDIDIPKRVLDDVLREVNRLARRHTKAAYSTLAARHVAEQLDKLYYDSGAPALLLPPSLNPSSNPSDPDSFNTNPNDHTDIDGDADLTHPTALALLPPTPPSFPSSPTPAQSKAYTTHLGNLTALAAKRTAQQSRLRRLRRLRATLEPLRRPVEHVQPGLATREGALGNELSRARTLGVRVGARVGGWKGGRGGREEGDDEGEEEVLGEAEKLRGVLVGF